MPTVERIDTQQYVRVHHVTTNVYGGAERFATHNPTPTMTPWIRTANDIHIANGVGRRLVAGRSWTDEHLLCVRAVQVIQQLDMDADTGVVTPTRWGITYWHWVTWFADEDTARVAYAMGYIPFDPAWDGEP